MAGPKIAVDTSAVIKLMKGDIEATDAFEAADEIHIPFVVRGELLYGLARSKTTWRI